MGSLRLVTATSAANPNEHDLFLDESGQLVWIGGDIGDALSYARMIAQRIHCRIMFIRQEWYLDLREGTPWKESLWRKGVTEETVRRVISDVIESTPGVQDLRTIDVSIDRQTRSAEVDFEAVSDMHTIVTAADLDAPIIIEVPL